MSVTVHKYTVPEDIVQNRLDICHSCPQYREQTQLCNSCGCLIDKKVKVSFAACPKSKWGVYDPKGELKDRS